MKQIRSRGSIMVGLVFMVATFSIVIYALLIVIGSQFDFTFRQVAYDQALNIAEAGVNYYRWHLAHNPEDYRDGNEEEGPYIHEYRDPQGDLVGYFSLEISAPEEGASFVEIASTGWSVDFPKVKRTVLVQYGQPSFASYSFVSDSSMWFGSGIMVRGPIHSNNGIRMDGTHTTSVTSTKQTYTCGSETGCSPSQTKDGVWGGGGPSELWDFPVTSVDFEGVNVDFNTIQTAAENESGGIYYGPSGSAGYHGVFNSNGTLSVYRVTGTSYRRGYDSSVGCTNLYERITSETLLDTYSLEDKNLLYVEDTLWLEGTVKGQMLVAAARFPLETYETNIWIRDNIVYEARDGTNKLGILSQHDIYFVLDIPDNFEIDAAMLAQSGKIIRHFYGYWWRCSSYSNAVRNNLTIYGTVISREKSYWNWGTQPLSGFRTRNVLYDQGMVYEPPPYFPTSGEYKFISWREQ